MESPSWMGRAPGDVQTNEESPTREVTVAPSAEPHSSRGAVIVDLESGGGYWPRKQYGPEHGNRVSLGTWRWWSVIEIGISSQATVRSDAIAAAGSDL